jgi:hypothetical protein
MGAPTLAIENDFLAVLPSCSSCLECVNIVLEASSQLELNPAWRRIRSEELLDFCIKNQYLLGRELRKKCAERNKTFKSDPLRLCQE